MTAEFILSIDQGTTGSTAVIVDVTDRRNVNVIARKTIDYPQHYPQSGWVEHDLQEVWTSVRDAVTGAVGLARTAAPGFDEKSLAAIGITNQRETLCVFERTTGKPLCRAIVWQCKRSTDICRQLKADGLEDHFRQRTGLVLDPYFSGTKISWLMENNPAVAEAVRAGRAVFGTIDTFLLHRLSGFKVHATEASNASRTLLFNIKTGSWDEELLRPLKVPGVSCLPEVKDSATEFGRTLGLGFLPDGIPVTGILGDQQAALAGQACFGVGEAKCTYGTGAFFLLNIGDHPTLSKNGLLTTVAWSVAGKRTYAFEGSAFIAGAAVQFLRDQLGLLTNAAESGKKADGETGAPEVYFVPALAGLGAPYWDPKAQGAFFGLTRGTTQGQVVRASLEGVAFQVCDLIDAMRADVKAPITSLRVDGGAVANDLLMQMQADLSGLTVDRPVNIETTAFGAAMFAGLGAGLYSSLAEIGGMRKSDRVFRPVSTTDARAVVAQQLAGWKRAVRAVRIFAGSVN